MTLIQKFFMAILPTRWAADLKAESQLWQVRCVTCGCSRSIWDIGGIRWKARSWGKRIAFHCPQCEGVRIAAVEKQTS